MSGPVISRSRIIAAPAKAIFDVLADPTAHAKFDGSGSVKAARGNPERLSQGARFGMDMKITVPYRITNQVVEFEEGRRIAWAHFGGHRWRYELEEVDGGTRVTETFDGSTSKAPFVLKAMGVEKKHPAAIETTLERLDRLVTGASTA